MSKRPISRRTLRSMRDRWQRDLDMIEAAYAVDSGNITDMLDVEHEVVRNLGTAIAYIDGLITRDEDRKP